MRRLCVKLSDVKALAAKSKRLDMTQEQQRKPLPHLSDAEVTAALHRALVKFHGRPSDYF